jgi:hypothetical protein
MLFIRSNEDIMALEKMDKDRREFIRTATNAVAVAPAVSLLLAGGVIPGTANAGVYGGSDSAQPLPGPAPDPDPLIPEPPLLYPEK